MDKSVIVEMQNRTTKFEKMTINHFVLEGPNSEGGNFWTAPSSPLKKRF
jgi:hypothetical protein